MLSRSDGPCNPGIASGSRTRVCVRGWRGTPRGVEETRMTEHPRCRRLRRSRASGSAASPARSSMLITCRPTSSPPKRCRAAVRRQRRLVQAQPAAPQPALGVQARRSAAGTARRPAQTAALRPPQRPRQGGASRPRDRAPAGRRGAPPARRRRPSGARHRPAASHRRLNFRRARTPGPIPRPKPMVRLSAPSSHRGFPGHHASPPRPRSRSDLIVAPSLPPPLRGPSSTARLPYPGIWAARLSAGPGAALTDCYRLPC